MTTAFNKPKILIIAVDHICRKRTKTRIFLFKQNDIEDKLKPILITATHRLVKRPDCVRNCPVLLNEDQQFTESIHFHTGCKHTKCLSNLAMQMRLQTEQAYEEKRNDNELVELKQILIGFHQYTILTVRLANQGEQAYSANLELRVQPALQIKKIESRCRSKIQQQQFFLTAGENRTSHDYLEIICSLGNPFERSALELQFVFDLLTTDYLDAKRLTINGSLHTSSALTAGSQVNQNLAIGLRRQVGVSLKEYVC